MTEKPEKPQDNEIDNQTPENDAQKSSVSTSDFDIEGALAAVASLEELTREPEPEILDDEPDELLEEDIAEIQEFERVDDVENFEIDPVSSLDVSHDDTNDEAIIIEPQYETAFPHPPMSVLHRGQLASVIPALLLMSVGAYLTFIFTTSELTLSPLLLGSIVLSALGIVLLSQWLSASRWTIGSFFLGLSMLLLGISSAYLTLPNNLSWVDGYPLLITAIGTAFVITDIVRPSGRPVWLLGLILAIIGIVSLIATNTLLDIVSPFSGILLPVAGIIVLFLLIAPLFTGRQQETHENSD